MTIRYDTAAALPLGARRRHGGSALDLGRSAVARRKTGRNRSADGRGGGKRGGGQSGGRRGMTQRGARPAETGEKRAAAPGARQPAGREAGAVTRQSGAAARRRRGATQRPASGNRRKKGCRASCAAALRFAVCAARQSSFQRRSACSRHLANTSSRSMVVSRPSFLSTLPLTTTVSTWPEKLLVRCENRLLPSSGVGAQ